MATFSAKEIIAALTRLGQFAEGNGEMIELLLVGGALMAVRYEAREATRDVDVLIRGPEPIAKVRNYAKMVAEERGWPVDWLNDAAKGYIVGTSSEEILLALPGIEVRYPKPAQMLAMKLSAWRDDLDISDARRLLVEIPGTREEVWEATLPHLFPGSELKARFALEDLWESVHGSD